MFYSLQFEADRRAFIITINSFGTELTKDDRVKLYPTIGKLHPEGLIRLAKCSDYEEVKAVADCYPVSAITVWLKIFEGETLRFSLNCECCLQIF